MSLKYEPASELLHKEVLVGEVRVGEPCGEGNAKRYLVDPEVDVQLKAQGPSRTCNESKEEEKKKLMFRVCGTHPATSSAKTVKSKPIQYEFELT